MKMDRIEATLVIKNIIEEKILRNQFKDSKKAQAEWEDDKHRPILLTRES